MSTHRERFLRSHGLPENTSLSIKEISSISKVPVSALEEIANRARGAWSHNLASVRLRKDYSKNPNTKTYPRSARLTPQEWEFGRIYSFLDKGKTYYTADSDIAKKYQV